MAISEALPSPAPAPEWWATCEDEIQNFIDSRIKRGTTEVLAVTPGGREVRIVSYGDPEPELKNTANFGSAVAARDANAYYLRSMRKRPVMVILAGPHGSETEGMISALSVLQLMETGKDIKGNEQPSLLAKLNKLRLVVIPLANPDGRVRYPYQGSVGLTQDQREKWAMGLKKNGERYLWPTCKAVQPMKGNVGYLGAYYDDNGINLMHDFFFSPLSAVTHELLKLVDREGPDILLNLHSHPSHPRVMPLSYVPLTVKTELVKLAEAYYNMLPKEGLLPGPIPHMVTEGAENTILPAFNLTSAFYHAGAALPFTFECPAGLSDYETPYGYEDILKIHHILFEAAAEYILER